MIPLNEEGRHCALPMGIRSLPPMMIKIAFWLLMLGASPVEGGEVDILTSAHDIESHLIGISASEADKLIARIQELQRQVKSGEAPPFGLLSGGSVNTPAITISPETYF